MDAARRIAARPDVMFAAAVRIVAKGGTPRRRRPCLDYHLLPAPDRTGYHSQDGSSCAANPGYRLALIAERPSGANNA